MDYSEKTLCSKRIFDGKVLKLRVDDVILPDGRSSEREIVEHRGGVGILAIEEGKIVLVRQFRKPIEKVTLEIPAGKLEPKEEPAMCGARELEEETGLIPEELKPITDLYTSPGYSSEKLYLFYCSRFKSGSIHRDEDEFMDVEYFEIDEVVKMIRDGLINDAKTICAVLMYLSGHTADSKS